MQDKNKVKKLKHQRRKARSKAKIFGTAKKPRLCVFKSLKHVFVQLIDDEKNKTLIGVSDKGLKGKNKVERALATGKLLAEKAQAKKIKQCVFDKSGYKYHGRIKAVADGAREGGLKF